MTTSFSRRDATLDAIRTKKPKNNLFMPLCYYDYFHTMPGYSGLTAETRDRGDGRPTCDELEYRVRFYEAIGAVFMDWCCARGIRLEQDSSVRISRRRDGRRETVVHETPVGTLTSVREDWSEYNAGFVVEPILKTVDDVRVYRYIIESETCAASYEAGADWLDIIGDTGVACHAGFCAPFHSLLRTFDAEHFLLMVADMPGEIVDLMDLIHKKNLERAEVVAGSPFEYIDFQSSWDIGIISPAIMREYYVPTIRDYTEVLHASGKLCHDHASGEDILPFADEIEKLGLDIMYGINITHDNMAAYRDLAERWEDKLIMCLGVDPMAMYSQPIDFVRHLCSELRNTFGDRPLLTGTADAVVAGTDVEKLQAIVDVLGAE